MCELLIRLIDSNGRLMDAPVPADLMPKVSLVGICTFQKELRTSYEQRCAPSMVMVHGHSVRDLDKVSLRVMEYCQPQTSGSSSTRPYRALTNLRYDLILPVG